MTPPRTPEEIARSLADQASLVTRERFEEIVTAALIAYGKEQRDAALEECEGVLNRELTDIACCEWSETKTEITVRAWLMEARAQIIFLKQRTPK